VAGSDVDSDPEREAERLAPAPPAPARGRLRRAVLGAAIDIGPLRRHRDLRLLFAGQSISFIGSMVTFVAIPFHAYAITGSSLVVGLLGLAELAPLLVTALIGGALADARDRRRMVQLAELAMACAAALLAVNALLPEPRLSVLFAAAAAMAACDGLARPSLEAMTPRLVSREELPAASALQALRGNFGMVAGPPLGGVLIATAGLPWTYAFDVLTFVVSLACLAAMRAVPPPPESEPPSLRGVIAGARYAWRRRELLGTYAVDMVAMFFGIPLALFPAVAADLGGPGVLGLLYAAPSAGSLAATLTSGWTGRVRRHGAAVAIAAGTWGAAIVAFGLAPNLAVALAALAVAGAADMTSGMFRLTMWNQTIPDELRGRLAGIEMLSYSSGPLLGNVESGVVAALAGVRASIVSGGIACIVGVAAVAVLLPAFWRYEAPPPGDADGGASGAGAAGR
jgi:MFS family permease